VALPLYYNWRNLMVRKLSTALTFAVVAVVVAVLAVLLSFAEGIRASLHATGSAQNVIVLQPGATAESTSFITFEESARIIQTPGVGRGPDGEVLCSFELCVQTSILRRGPDGTPANVAVRGIDPHALRVHPEVRLVEGRIMSPGAPEVIVGRAARDRYAGLEVGGRVPLGRLANREFDVVGLFEAGGGALESEIWTDRATLSGAFERRFVSSAVLHLDDASKAGAAIEYLRSPAVRLNAMRESDYYATLTSKTREIVWLTTVLVTLMGIGAAFAVANTLYASVDGRRREIAMLRTLGFGRTAILAAFVVEALLVCMAACVAGLAVGLLVHGSRQDFLSDTTWTVLAYELSITPRTAVSALVLSLLVGLAGGLAPALRASRIRIIEALRKA